MHIYERCMRWDVWTHQHYTVFVHDWTVGLHFRSESSILLTKTGSTLSFSLNPVLSQSHGKFPDLYPKAPSQTQIQSFLSFGPALVFLRFPLPWFPIWIFLMGNCGILGKIPSKFLLLPFIPLLCHLPYLPPSPPPTLLSHKEVDIKCFDITL